MVKISGKEEKIINELIDEAEQLMADWPSARNQQKQFVLEYIKNNFTNATEAARRAGYEGKYVHKTASDMKNGVDKYGHIKEVIEKFQESFDEKSTELSVATSLEIRQFLTRVMRGEEMEVEMINVGDYRQELVEVPTKLPQRLKSAELLGKSYSLWTDKLDANIHSDISINIGEWDDD